MKIVRQSGIDAAAWKHLTGWRDQVFPVEGEGMEWSQVSWHLLAFDKDDLPVAHVGYDKFTIEAGGTPLPVAGVGGVVVRPEYQGQGLPRLLFDTLHTEAGPALGVDVYTLFCPERLVSYYQKLGYCHHRGNVLIPQFGEDVLSSFQFLYRAPASLRQPVKLLTPPW